MAFQPDRSLHLRIVNVAAMMESDVSASSSFAKSVFDSVWRSFYAFVKEGGNKAKAIHGILRQVASLSDDLNKCSNKRRSENRDDEEQFESQGISRQTKKPRSDKAVESNAQETASTKSESLIKFQELSRAAMEERNQDIDIASDIAEDNDDHSSSNSGGGTIDGTQLQDRNKSKRNGAANIVDSSAFALLPDRAILERDIESVLHDLRNGLLLPLSTPPCPLWTLADFAALLACKFLHGLTIPGLDRNTARHHGLYGKLQAVEFSVLHEAVIGCVTEMWRT